MNIIFNTSFKSGLLKYGNTYKLSSYRLANYSEVSATYDTIMSDSVSKSDFYKFDSLWTEESRKLNILITPEVYIGKSVGIIIYYSDLCDNIIDVAFILTGINKDTEMAFGIFLCEKNNLINVSLPSNTVANIYTNTTDDDISFIENSSNIVGVNTILVDEGEFEDSDILTKKSYKKYIRRQISESNDLPLYLDKNGEKVYSITSYKHYKSVNIKILGYEGALDSSNIMTYYIGGGNTVGITGNCTYDLYKVSNGIYTIEKENCTEGLENAIIKQCDSKGTILTKSEISDNYTLNQGLKTVTFKTETEVEKTHFILFLNFNSEIGDTKGTSVSLYSEVVQFVTYLNWSVEYSSSLSQTDSSGNSHIVLLFDKDAGSNGWNYDENSTDVGKPGIISIYSKSDIDTNNIEISSENDTIFNEYFSITKSKENYDTVNKRYKYTISITTNHSCVGEDWFPSDSNGNSILLLNTIKIIGSDNTTSDEIKFYCVQRALIPIGVKTYSETTGWSTNSGYLTLTFPDSLGSRSIKNVYVINPVGDYNTWKLSDSSYYSVVGTKSDSLHRIVDGDTAPSSDYSLTVYNNYEQSSGYLTFERRNSAGGFDKTYWKDLIYCHASNNTNVNIKHSDISTNKDAWSINPSNYTIDISNLKFYKDKTNTYYRLYSFFDTRSDTTNFVITATYSVSSSYSGKVTLSYEDESILKYFDFNITTNKTTSTDGINYIYTYTVNFNNKTDYDAPTDKAWFPGITGSGSYEPIGVTVSDGVNSEKFYCVIISSSLKNSIEYYDANTLEKITSVKFKNSDSVVDGKRSKKIFIASSISISSLNYWAMVSKDPDINIVTESDNYGVTGIKLLSTSDISNWKTNGIVTTISTSYQPTDTIDFNLDDLVIRRVSAKYTTIDDLMDDWSNQISRNINSKLGIEMEGKDPSTSLKVYIADDGGNLSELKDEDPIELDRIGLYKLYIRSSDKFRVSIANNSSKSENNVIQFFDTSINEIKDGVTSQDEGYFDNVVGREVCFAFIGDSTNTPFLSKDETFDSYVVITNLGDNTSIYFPIHRKYFENQVDSTLSTPAIDTNIERLGSDSNGTKQEIFIDSSSTFNYKIQFRSYVESSYSFSLVYNSTLKASGQITIPETDVKLNYNTYLTTGQVKRNGITTKFGSRGYVNHDANIKFEISSDNTSYPIPYIGRVDVTNPYKYNGEIISYYAYQLLPIPIPTPSANSVGISYMPGKSATVLITKPTSGFTYKVEYKSVNDTALIDITSLTGTVNSNGFNITRDVSKDEIDKVAYTFTDNTGVQNEGDTTLLGIFKFTNYVDKNNFIKDISGNIVTNSSYYTQEKVDEFAGTKSTSLNIKRLSKADSASFIEGSLELVKKLGESRAYTLNLINKDATVDVTTSLSSQSSFLSSMTFDGNTTLNVGFKSRLYRHSYYPPISLSSYKDSGSLAKVYSYYSGSYESEEFFVNVGTEKVVFSNLYQEKFEYGLLINKDYKNSLFIGPYSDPSSPYSLNYSKVTVNYDTTSVVLYISSVKLPTSNTNLVLSDAECPTVEYSSNLNEYNCYLVSTLTNDSINYGYKLTINFSDNSGTSSVTYSVTIKDNHGSELKYDIIQSPRDKFYVKLFNNFYTDSSGNNYVYSGDIVDSVAFSASGSLRIPDKYLYLLTDAPESICNQGFWIYSILEGVDREGAAADDKTTNISGNVDYQLTETISGEFLGESSAPSSTIDVTSATPNGYRLYRMTPSSKISKLRPITVQTTGIFNVEDWMGYCPSVGQTTISLVGGSGNSTYFLSRYGVCNIKLSEAYLTYLNCKLWEVESDGSILSDNDIKGIVDFSTVASGDIGETSKYVTYGSIFSSNIRSYRKSNYDYYDWYYIDNIIYVKYREATPYKYTIPINLPTAMDSAFRKFGYYCGFYLTANRKEWYLDGTVWKLDEFSDYSFSSSDNSLVLVDTNTADKKDMTIYKDYSESTSGTRSADNPYTKNLLKYYSSSDGVSFEESTSDFPSKMTTATANSSGITVPYSAEFSKNVYKPGLVFNMIPYKDSSSITMTSGSEIYTTSRTLMITNNTTTTNSTGGDGVSFTFDFTFNMSKS